MTYRISNIAFDLGGVVIALSYENAIRRFEEIGLPDARQHLDAFHQHGIFGDLESGRISAEVFRAELSKIIGRQLTMDECFYAWWRLLKFYFVTRGQARSEVSKSCNGGTILLL